MTLRVKLVIIVLLVALVPLVISAFTGLRVHQQAVYDSTKMLHLKVAEHGATLATSHFDTVERTLSMVTKSIDWPALNEAERIGALWLVYRQLPDIATVALLDENGKGLETSVYRDTTTKASDLKDHPQVTMDILTEFAKRIPFADTKQQGFAMGEAFAGGDFKEPFLPLAVKVKGPQGTSWVIAVNLWLGSLCKKLNAATPPGSNLYLVVDESHRATCLRSATETFHVAHDALHFDHPRRRVSRSGASEKDRIMVRFANKNGEQMVAAVSPAKAGWSAVVEQPEAVAFAASQRMKRQTIFWIVLSFVAALAAGLFLAQGISRPVAVLVKGALEVAKGNFEHRLASGSRDEFGRLSDAFNHMSEEVKKRDNEIRAWNKELQQRVEDRTRELTEAQAQLLQSQKIAAVTSLGAGVAHEINNPLTSVIGLVQVVQAKLKKEGGKDKLVELLETVENEGLRIKDIVRTLLTFSQDYGGEGFASLDLHKLLDECLSLVENQNQRQQIDISKEYEQQAHHVLGNRSQLQQAFLHLLNNSRIAMANGGRLTLSTSVVDGRAIRVAVTDTGKGIAPEHIDKIFEPFFTTKDNWRGEGLGLSVAFRIITEHHGKITAQSKVQEGTTMTVTLPVADTKAHLV
jgi:signal transduction histidine kinase